MAAVLGARGGVDIPESDRKKAYNFLAGYYKKLDREVPEFHACTEGQWKGIEEMLDVKVGAVLNKKNKENLKQAQELIQEVLDSAETTGEEGISETEQKNKQKEEQEAREKAKIEKEKREKEEAEQKVLNEVIERLKKLQERTDYLTGKVS